MSLVKRTQFIPHPEGLTVGTLADIQLDEAGKYGAQIKWMFDTEELMPDGQMFRQTYWTTPTLNEKSNLSRLLKAFGEDPDDVKWEVETVSEFDDLIGRRVQLNIIHKVTETGTVARIDGILPLPRRRPDPAPVAAPPRGRTAGKDIWADEA
jgi:hypothetical protein